MSSFLNEPRLAQCRRIFLRDWRVNANIGAYTAERNGTQELLLNIDVYVSFSASTSAHDELREVFDYECVRDLVQERLSRGHINLQETLVDDLARELLRKPGVLAVRVSSEKTTGYIGMAGIGVEVVRFREGA